MSTRLVRGEGPVPNDIAIIGEAPGKNEHYKRRPFVGQTGMILDVNLMQAGISRQGIWVGNVFPSWLGRDKAGNDITPTEEQVWEEIGTLVGQLREVRPRIIGSVGRVATRLFLGDVTMEAVHGIPHWVPKERWEKLGMDGEPPMLMPIVHPAAGFKKEQEGVKSFWDTKQLGLLAKGKIQPVELRPPEYTVMTHPGGELSVAALGEAGEGGQRIIALDTEGSLRRPICLSFCTNGRNGVVVFPSLRTLTLRQDDLVILHYAAHDIPILRKMGVNIDDVQIEDTIVLAYVLGIEPRGLKALARRHLHFDMVDYESVAGPYYDAACLRYVALANKTEWGKPKERLILDPKTRKKRLYRPQPINTRFKGMMKTYATKPGILHGDQWEKRWDSIPEDARTPVEEKHGEFPRFSEALAVTPKEEWVDYAGLDAVSTFLVRNKLWERVDALGLREVAEQDMAIVPLISRMQDVGVKADRDRFKHLERTYRTKMIEVERKIHKLAGKHINPGSSQQVSDLLFKTLGLTAGHFTKTGAKSVGRKALASLNHQIVTEIVRYKGAAKLLSFAKGLPTHIQEDGRIRGRVKYWNVVSGRFSMAEPNMQQIPSRSEEGMELRMCFICDDGHILLASDYDQLEMKVLAHFSKDRRLIKYILDGVDIHNQTAASIFGVNIQDVTKLQRTVMKTTNYGIIYQIQEKGLYDQLKIAGVEGFDMDDCVNVLTEWFKLYPGVPDFVEEVGNEARRYGGVRSMHGRMRWLPNIYSPVEYMRAEAQRKAVSHKVSSTATDIIKRAMRRLGPWLKEQRKGCYAEAILQIHDEVLFELDHELDWCGPTVQKIMCADSDDFRVPITAGANIGQRWGELK